MIPRPFHRWKSFWLGVLILAFTGWAWARSWYYLEGVFWFPKTYTVTAAQTTGRIEFAWDHSFAPFPMQMLNWIHEPAEKTNEPWFPKAVIWETYDHQIQVTIAHWFLMLLFLVVWSGFLLWRGRRLARLARSPKGDRE